MNDKSEFYMPVSIHFGESTVHDLSEICKNFGKNILFITSRDIEHISNQILINLQKEKFSIDVFYLEAPEPTVSFIDESSMNIQKKYDCLIALGGGSAMDMAKTLAIKITNKKSIWEYANLSYKKPSPITNEPIPIIAIPTTSGTGSEVTPYAVLSNSKLNQKGTIQDKKIFPKVAIIDPDLMLSLPPLLTSSTGIDALAHSLESFMNISKSSIVSEMYSVESIKIIFDVLPKTFSEPSNIEHRTKMAWASSLAGISISHRGTTTTHAIAEVIGGLTGIPHGICVAVSTLPVLIETINHETNKLSELNNLVFNNEFTSPQENANNFLERVKRLLKEIDLNKNIQHFAKEQNLDGLDRNVLDYLLKFKFRPLKQHPIEFSKDTLKNIIRDVLYGN